MSLDLSIAYSELSKVGPLRNKETVGLRDWSTDHPSHAQFRGAEVTPWQWGGSVCQEGKVRVIRLTNQFLDCLHHPLCLSVALGIEWTASNMLESIRYCKCGELVRGVLWPIVTSYNLGMPCRENTALSAAMILLEVVEDNFVTSG